MTPTLVSLLLGADSAILGAAVAPLVSSATSRSALAVAFGLADGAATVIGAGTEWRPPGALTTIVPIVFAALYATYLAGITRWIRGNLANRVTVEPDTRRFRASWLWPLPLLPFVASIDNLAYGVDHGPLGAALVAHAAIFAGSSFIFGFAGLTLGWSFARSKRPAPHTYWPALAVLISVATVALS